MATTIMTKKKYIEYLSKQLNDNDIILMTQEGTEVEVVKKRNEKNIKMSFAADAFKKADCVGDIGTGKVPVLAIAICKEEHCSDETLKMLGIKPAKKKINYKEETAKMMGLGSTNGVTILKARKRR